MSRAITTLTTLLALLLLPIAVHSEVKRYLAGNSADVHPPLHGPAHHFQGGGTDVDSAFQWMFDQVRGCTDCDTKLDVVVLRARGDDDYNDYLLAMKGVDSVETLIIPTRADAMQPELDRTIRNAEIVFFAGGDQCNYVTNFKGTPVQAAVETVYARGGGISGTSAGDAMQSEFLYDACNGSTTSQEALANPYHESISFTDDFFHWRYMNGTMTDQHLVERNRIGRTFAFLAREIQDQRTNSILGIAANRETTVELDKNGLATIAGLGPVYFILADHPPEVCKANTPLTYTNFKLWKVDSGGTFDLKNRPSTAYYTRSVVDGVINNNPYSPDVCDASAAVKKALQGSKDYDALEKKFPEDLFVLQAHLDSLEPQAAVAWTDGLLDENGKDATNLYLAARAERKANLTDKAIENLKKAMAANPRLAIARLELAAVYSKANHAGVKQTLETFLQACPREFEAYQYVESTDDTEYMQKKAEELRRYLNHATGDEYRYYATLWPLELKSTPEKDQPALREQIAEDTRELQLAGIEESKAVIAGLRKIDPDRGIDIIEHPEIGGVRQWISIRGRDRKNPVLLVIHGGPGIPLMASSWAYQTPWEDYFTVVEWDQRGVGKNYAYLKDEPITIDRIAQDAEELVAYLRGRLQKEKVVVLASSWGAEIGVRLALARPEWLSGYVSVGSVDDETNPDTFTGLSQLGPEYYREDVDSMPEALKNVKALLHTRSSDLSLLGTDFKVPVVMMVGSKAVRYEAAKTYFDKIRAPHKKFISFEGSTGLPMIESPGKFLLALTQEVLPLMQ